MSDETVDNSSPIDLIGQLEKLGLTVRVRPDGRLGVSPSSGIPPELVAKIKLHRDGMVEALLLCERAERLFGGELASGDGPPGAPSGDASDLPELLRWWDASKHSLPVPLRLARGVRLADVETLDRWVNDSLTAGCRAAVADQLRWVRTAAEEAANETS